MIADCAEHGRPGPGTGTPIRWRLAVISAGAFALAGATTRAPSVLSGMRSYPVGYGTRVIDERRDPWVAVTDATVAPLLIPEQRRVHRARRIVVDYDADGVPDTAWMVANGTQMGVLVRLGATGRTVVAYRADGRWTDQQLYRAGTRSIGIEFPESTMVTLSSQGGQPMVYYMDEGGR